MRHLPGFRIAIFRPAAVLLAVALVALGAAPPPSAASTRKILETCSEGKIPRGYSQQAYNQALRRMPPELSEYSDCSDLIHKAQLAAATGTTSGGSGGGTGPLGAAAATAPPSPSEQHALERATHRGNAPVSVGGEPIHPGVVHVDIASALSALPTPLLSLLVLLAACALWLLGRGIYARARGIHRGAPR